MSYWRAREKRHDDVPPIEVVAPTRAALHMAMAQASFTLNRVIAWEYYEESSDLAVTNPGSPQERPDAVNDQLGMRPPRAPHRPELPHLRRVWAKYLLHMERRSLALQRRAAARERGER